MCWRQGLPARTNSTINTTHANSTINTVILLSFLLLQPPEPPLAHLQVSSPACPNPRRCWTSSSARAPLPSLLRLSAASWTLFKQEASTTVATIRTQATARTVKMIRLALSSLLLVTIRSVGRAQRCCPPRRTASFWNKEGASLLGVRLHLISHLFSLARSNRNRNSKLISPAFPRV